MRKKFASLMVLLLVISSLVSGCGYSMGMVSSEKKGKMDYSYSMFNDDKSHSEKLKEGQTLTLDYSITVNKGVLTVSVLDPDGEEVLKKQFTQSSNDKIDINAQKTGKYSIHVKGEKTSGGCHIKLSIN